MSDVRSVLENRCYCGVSEFHILVRAEGHAATAAYFLTPEQAQLSRRVLSAVGISQRTSETQHYQGAEHRQPQDRRNARRDQRARRQRPPHGSGKAVEQRFPAVMILVICRQLQILRRLQAIGGHQPDRAGQLHSRRRGIWREGAPDRFHRGGSNVIRLFRQRTLGWPHRR
jgi:hypothetical protein